MTLPIAGATTNLGLPTLPDIDQLKYPEIFAQFLRVQNAIGILQQALDTYTGAQGATQSTWSSIAPGSYLAVQNISKYYAICSEAINYGAMVNFYSNAGVTTARNANATTATKPAHAYCNVSSGLASGATGEFVLMGYAPITGLTPGTTYYLSATNGLITTLAPTASGSINQAVGFALATTGLMFNPSQQYTVHA